MASISAAVGQAAAAIPEAVRDSARALLPPPVAAAPVTDCDMAAADTKAPAAVALPTTTAPPPLL